MTRLRFAPSPTGLLHLGNTRTALVNWLFARAHKGTFILRMDDTDVERSRAEYVHAIHKDMEWLGLTHDEYYTQSERLEFYHDAVEKLKAMGRLYPCYETSEELDLQRKVQLSSGRPPVYNRAALKLTESEKKDYEAQGRTPHWRFLLKEEEVTWNDLIRGHVSMQATHMSDPVLIRADGTPVYTIASVVDDIDMGVTHILRGEDHVSNAAVQVQLIEALTGQPNHIVFGHMALITGKEGEGLSKRIGSLSLQELHRQGMEPMSINSLLSKLGTSDPITPHLHLDELIRDFRMESFGRATPKLAPEDLWHMNAKILHLMPYEDVLPSLKEKDWDYVTPEFWNVIHGNIEKIDDIFLWWEAFYGHAMFKAEDPHFIRDAQELLPLGPWDEGTCKIWMDAVKDKTGRKGPALFKPLRYALTGQDHGPEMKDVILLMGRSRVMERLTGAQK